VTFEAIAAAPPDGYTLGAVPTPVLSTIPIERASRYRVEDFTFIANVVDDPGAIYVNAASPHRTLADLVAAARTKPGELAVGTAGIGSDDHLLLLALEAASATSFSHIPYNGTQPIVTGVLNGDLAAGSFNVSEGLGLVRQGALRMLAQGGASRWSAAAEVPTFREQGFEVTGGSTRGFVAPSGLPAEIRDRLRAAFAAGLADPKWTAEAERLSLPLRIMNGEDQRSYYLSEDARLRALWQQKPWKERE
jgi:tripartite-type tricarboxylate transporter receptor subunit TctC